MHKVGLPPGHRCRLSRATAQPAGAVELVDYISVTGSTATGRKIAVQAAEA